MSEEMKQKVEGLVRKLNDLKETDQIAVTAFSEGVSMGRALAGKTDEGKKKNGQN